MSEKYISVDNLLQWIGERITCEALCSNSMKSDKGCDGNCILGEITPREKSIISVITESIKNAPAADVEPVVRGTWEEHPITDTTDEGEQYVAMFWQCSNCHGKLIYWNFQRTKYCPDCGAHMMERSGSGE